jgi:hypothetical protein
VNEEREIPKDGLEKENTPAENVNEHFQADSHAPQTQTSNPIPIASGTQPIKEMEVHHHSHAHGKKTWKAYFWEFLMLFLAVFCGFLAENQREHMIEHQRAKQFARSLLSDFKADIAALNAAFAYGNKKIRAIDSLFTQIELPVEKWKDTLVYKYSGTTARVRPFERSSGTYDQMKASGSLRYFKQELADLLNKYDVQAKKAEARESIGLKYIDLYNPLQTQILDVRSVIQIQDRVIPTHSLVFRNTTKETIALWINYAAIVQSTQERTLIEYNSMIEKAKQIIEELKKEYHLE